MLNESDIKILKGIAFHLESKPNDIVSSCVLLFKEGVDLYKMQSKLEDVYNDSKTPDSIKIKSIALLGKVREELLQKQENVMPDKIEKTKKELMEKYVHEPK